MINLNDSIFDYKQYCVYADRNHPEFIVEDTDVLSRLQSYEDFEKRLINNILSKKTSLYLRFCDGEFLYYQKGFSIHKWIQKMLGRDATCRGEKPNPSLIKEHFKVFEKHKDHIFFFPHTSNSYINIYNKSKLADYIKEQHITIGHFYYIYHFLNKLRRKMITDLQKIKIAYITHNKYITGLDHYQITSSYSWESIEYLKKQDFSSYDLLLLGGGTASPLYADAIATSAHCPIIDAGYMLNVRESQISGARAFSF